MKIRLFSASFPVTDTVRLAEYEEVLRRNCKCESIDEICLFREGDADPPIRCTKLDVRRAPHRPLYSEYFAWMNEFAAPDDVSILANADIYFDDQLELFRRWSLPSETAFMLATWDVDDRGDSSLRYRNDSQDVWIFRGPVRPVASAYPVGVARCDNRIAYDLAVAGYTVENPSFSIKTHHLHAGERRRYAEGIHSELIPPPYRYQWPHNLWPLPRTAAYNRKHPSQRIGWRFDKKWWEPKLKLHWFSKALKTLRGRRLEGLE